LSARRHFEASLGIYPVPWKYVKGHTSERKYLLFFGRNDVFQKGLDVLVSGYSRAVSQGLDLPLIIAGQPSKESQKLTTRAMTLPGLQDRIVVLGAVSEEKKWQLLAGARCLVFPSRWDGPPRPVREALAVGTPVIVSPGTNLAELVERYRAGCSVRLTSESVSAALIEAQENPPDWRTGAAALRTALDWDKVASHYAAGYSAALEAAGAPR
jgi:hypothetical protein